jgi:predicted CXXCH cytochrome family protein
MLAYWIELPIGMRRLLIWLGAVVSAQALAQDIDTIVSPLNRRPFTYLDQIENARERGDFLKLYREREPLAKKRRADAFLKAWPDSWLLAQVYEIAAKASIELDDYPAALQYGKDSLRLLPENPLLLVPLANVEAQQKLLGQAVRSATEALEYLDRFDRPASIGKAQWAVVQRQLRASAYFVLGRVAATEALSSADAQKSEKLRLASIHLTRARELNPNDPEIDYLLGLVDLSLGNEAAAANAFLSASRAPGSLQAKALEQLARLRQRGAARTGDFPPAPSRVHPAVQAPASSTRYAGSEACRACHSAQYAAWRQTGMARMLRPYDPENIMGDFEKKQFLDDSGFVVAQMWKEANRHYFATRLPDGSWSRRPVDYTIGSKWQQAYATRLPNGQIHVFPLQYNSLRGAWINYWKIIDPAGSERADIGGFYRLTGATNYQQNCAPCHTSQLRSSKPGSMEAESLVFREAGVNCEMCHGPSSAHIEAVRAGRPYPKQPLDPPVDFQKIGAGEYMVICSQCHMQSAMREPGPQGEWNYSEQGRPFFRNFLSRPFVEFSRQAFYKDGRFRETTFIAEALLRTACYKRGKTSCGHCHDPHPADAASNPASLKYRDNPDQMCVQCHAAYRQRVGHTHHPASSEASRCVSCHMPRILNGLMFLARSHQIDDIPRADTTLRFGQRESPNACLICHQDKDALWALRELRVW